MICLRCLHPRFIDWRLFFPLLSRTGRRPTLATLTLDLCDTGFHPITVAKTARDQPQPTERKPRLIIKRHIFIARRKVFLERFQRQVNASGSTHRSRSSKFYPNRRYCGPPTVRNVSTARAREKPGMFLQTANHRGYIKTTTLPPISRVSLVQSCSHPLTIAQF